MATKIRRSLYIGLGGTGMTSLLHTKRMFIDTYGEVPPMIGFLGIDTDGGVYNKTLESKYGEVRLDTNEQLPIQVNDAAQIYQVNEAQLTWVPKENMRSMSSMMTGAGMVRSNGRFAFTVNYNHVLSSVQQKINQITSADHINNDKYKLLSKGEPEIHLVFSLAGGTGSGTFINVAYMLKHVAKNCKLTGYAVLPDVFEAMSPGTMPNVKANAYGAIMDLDWFMHRGIGQPTFDIKYLRGDMKVDDRPFNSIIFVNNRNINGDTYNHVDQLAEMISLALVTSAGELSVASTSVSDNLDRCIANGNMDVESKAAWVAGMGASEVIFCGADLGEIYELKAANYIIENLLNTCTDTDLISNNWIDTLQIRENNGCDQVIDYVMKRDPQWDMSAINSPENPHPEVEGYVNSQIPNDAQLHQKVQELKDKTLEAFHHLIVNEINKECGVGSVEKILMGLAAQFDIMMGEMKNEREEWSVKVNQADEAATAAEQDLIEYVGRFFKRNAVTDEKKNDVMASARQRVVARREVLRRNKAIEFYNYVLNLISEENEKVSAIRTKLENVYRDNTTRIAQIQNRMNNEHQIFQLDLAQDYVGKISVNTEEINFTDLFNSMPAGDRVHNFDAMSNKEVDNLLLDYTCRLNGATHWTGMTLDDVLKGLSEEDFNRILEKAVRKSMPLLTYDLKGYQPLQSAVDIVYAGVPSKQSRINKDAIKAQFQGVSNVDHSVIGMKDRVIIYRQVGVVPAFAISTLSNYKSKYELGHINYHIDAGLEQKMQRENWSLWPTRAADNSLELWVKGLIFGLIKNEDGKYWYKDTEEGNPLFDYWVELAQYRDDAFNEFRKKRAAIEAQFEDYFTKLQREKGEAYINQRVAEAKEGNNYFDNISQIGMTRQQLTMKGAEPILKQITDELNYVKKEL